MRNDEGVGLRLSCARWGNLHTASSEENPPRAWRIFLRNLTNDSLALIAEIQTAKKCSSPNIDIGTSSPCQSTTCIRVSFKFEPRAILIETRETKLTSY